MQQREGRGAVLRLVRSDHAPGDPDEAFGVLLWRDRLLAQGPECAGRSGGNPVPGLEDGIELGVANGFDRQLAQQPDELHLLFLKPGPFRCDPPADLGPLIPQPAAARRTCLELRDEQGRHVIRFPRPEQPLAQLRHEFPHAGVPGGGSCADSAVCFVLAACAARPGAGSRLLSATGGLLSEWICDRHGCGLREHGAVLHWYDLDVAPVSCIKMLRWVRVRPHQG